MCVCDVSHSTVVLKRDLINNYIINVQSGVTKLPPEVYCYMYTFLMRDFTSVCMHNTSLDSLPCIEATKGKQVDCK